MAANIRGVLLDAIHHRGALGRGTDCTDRNSHSHSHRASSRLHYLGTNTHHARVRAISVRLVRPWTDECRRDRCRL